MKQVSVNNCLSYYCCVTNHPNSQWLKRIVIFIFLIIQHFELGSSEHFFSSSCSLCNCVQLAGWLMAWFSCDCWGHWALAHPMLFGGLSFFTWSPHMVPSYAPATLTYYMAPQGFQEGETRDCQDLRASISSTTFLRQKQVTGSTRIQKAL